MANSIAKEVLFTSGFKIGSGLTFQLDSKIHEGITYLDTPGLADVNLRMKASEAINKALKKNGTYQIFFVITLESGRLRSEDMATIKLVLNSTKDIKNYSLIINKLSPQVYNCLIEKEKEELKILVKEIVTLTQHTKNLPAVLLLQNQSDLTDHKNKIIKMDELDRFAKDAPCITVAPDSVKDIIQDPMVFEKVVQILAEYIEELREDRKRLNKQLKEAEKKNQKLQSDNSQRLRVIFLL